MKRVGQQKAELRVCIFRAKDYTHVWTVGVTEAQPAEIGRTGLVGLGSARRC